MKDPLAVLSTVYAQGGPSDFKVIFRKLHACKIISNRMIIQNATLSLNFAVIQTLAVMLFTIAPSNTTWEFEII